MAADRVAVALGVVLELATAARTDDVARCRTALLAGAARHAQAVARSLGACVVRGGAAVPCAGDARVRGAGERAAAEAARRVARVCCGRDRRCGTGDDVTLAELGWSSPDCPGLGDAACPGAVDHAGDVATCAACVGTAAAVRAVGLDAAAESGAGAARRCRAAVATASARLFVARSRALARCWRARVRAGGMAPCPDAAATAALARAAAAAGAHVCRACGGADGCGGADDVAPSAAGLPSTCPAVAVPEGASCGGAIGSAAELSACVGCVAAFAGDCADRLAVPGLAADPAVCHPPSAPCIAGVQCAEAANCPRGYACADNGGGTRYCVGPVCTGDAACLGGAVCRQYCTRDGCGERRCQCPGFGCTGPGELCTTLGETICQKSCTQDSDCIDPFGFVCVNSRFGAGLCIGSVACQ